MCAYTQEINILGTATHVDMSQVYMLSPMIHILVSVRGLLFFVLVMAMHGIRMLCCIYGLVLYMLVCKQLGSDNLVGVVVEALCLSTWSTGGCT